MLHHGEGKNAAARSGTAQPEPSAAESLPSCDPRCGRFATCRPDSPGWVSKKEAAANLATNPSALYQRAMRVGYNSPTRKGMPRGDQPKLCLDAAYFVLKARTRKRK